MSSSWRSARREVQATVSEAVGARNQFWLNVALLVVFVGLCALSIAFDLVWPIPVVLGLLALGCVLRMVRIGKMIWGRH